MIATILAAILACQAPPFLAADSFGDDGLVLNPINTPAAPSLPTGVVHRPDTPHAGVRAHGPHAARFLRESTAPGPTPDLTERPYLALIGPPDATGQFERAIPPEIAQRIHIRKYDPSDKVDAEHIKRLRVSAVAASGASLWALVKAPTGRVEFDAAADLAEVLACLRRLLGLEPAPAPSPFPPLPHWPILNPDGYRKALTMYALLIFGAGLVVGALGPVVIRATLRAAVGGLAKAVKDALAVQATAPPNV